MPHCSSCGSRIPEGQGKSCSMCYGDPDHGTDRYYRKWMEQEEEKQEEKRRQEYEEGSIL